MTDPKELRRLAAAVKRFAAPWEHIHGGIWCPSEKGGQTKFIDIRGWGYLTGGGHGALGLPSEEAAAIQDALGDYVAAANPKAVTALLDDSATLERHNKAYLSELDKVWDALGMESADVEYHEAAAAMKSRAEKAEAEREQLRGQVKLLSDVLTKAGSAIWTAHGCAQKLKAGMGDRTIWGAAEVDWWIDAIEETYVLRREINVALDVKALTTPLPAAATEESKFQERLAQVNKDWNDIIWEDDPIPADSVQVRTPCGRCGNMVHSSDECPLAKQGA